jgi:hypothetical protein
VGGFVFWYKPPPLALSGARGKGKRAMWTIEPSGIPGLFTVYDDDGNPISKDKDRATAARIVAAWNACAGISTEALEAAGEGGVITLVAAAKTVAYETGGPDGKPLTASEQIALGMLRSALTPFEEAAQ